MTETTNWKNEVNELMALEWDNVGELINDGDLSEENGKSIKEAITFFCMSFSATSTALCNQPTMRIISSEYIPPTFHFSS